jgi:uncharacterized membrane protein YphA (DoxX/SURF4 family)
MKIKLILYWAARLVAAVIMVQTLYFKFTGAPESIEIFTKAGMEPWGRYATGVAELIASVLLLINPTAWIGAGVALALMAGAIGMHLTRLGIEVQDDGGLLFVYALLVAGCALGVLLFNKERIVGTIKSVIG